MVLKIRKSVNKRVLIGFISFLYKELEEEGDLVEAVSII